MLLHHRSHRAGLHAYGTGRAGRSGSRPAEADHDDGPGLLASPAFWGGGLLALGVWVGLAAVLGVI
jgi:hypothetical protein